MVGINIRCLGFPKRTQDQTSRHYNVYLTEGRIKTNMIKVHNDQNKYDKVHKVYITEGRLE